MAGVMSKLDDEKKDRVFAFSCNAPLGLAVTPDVEWSTFNTSENVSKKTCDGNSALVGIHAKWNAKEKDRTYQYKCATFHSRNMGYTMDYGIELWSKNDAKDGRSVRDCGSGMLVGIGSSYDGTSKDRTWKYLCGDIKNPKKDLGLAINTNTVNMESAEESTYKTLWHKDWTFECPAGGVIAGMDSYHKSKKDDRIFKFKCNMPSGMHVTPHAWSAWTQSESQFQNLCRSWTAISGIDSKWSASKKDRQFRFKCALLWF